MISFDDDDDDDYDDDNQENGDDCSKQGDQLGMKTKKKAITYEEL